MSESTSPAAVAGLGPRTWALVSIDVEQAGDNGCYGTAAGPAYAPDYNREQECREYERRGRRCPF